MGNTFSGWHGRRSSRPYFDELPRIAIGDIPTKDADKLLWNGVTVRLTLVPQNLGGTALRFFCPCCNRTVTVLYFTAAPRCYCCADARYRSHSESPSRRALRRAEKIFRQWKPESGRKDSKPKWMRWPTYWRLVDEAEAVLPIMEAAERAPYDLLKRKS